jgi:hypothetical protein
MYSRQRSRPDAEIVGEEISNLSCLDSIDIAVMRAT